MNNNHKVYASSSDDDSPAGFLQSAYNSAAGEPAVRRRGAGDLRCYGVGGGRERERRMRSSWNSRGPRTSGRSACAGTPTTASAPTAPSASATPGGEADAVVHLVGIVAFSAGAGALLHACCVHEPSVETTVSLLLYVCSLLTMLGCSFLCGNQTPGAPRHRRDVIPITCTHWLISTQVRSSSTARRGRGGTWKRCSSRIIGVFIPSSRARRRRCSSTRTRPTYMSGWLASRPC